MGWQDRPYYRDRDYSTGGNPLMWLLTGSVPLFTIFGIRVRAHAMLLVLIGLVLLLPGGFFGNTIVERVQAMSVLFLVILLHEFGHCFAARYMGGDADEILMTPLGGLAMAMAPRKPWPQFVTVACGPLVNVAICLVCGIGIYLIHGIFPLGWWHFGEVRPVAPHLLQVSSYLFWFYAVSWFLLLFNLLPVFPLDGGQLLNAILWKPMGYYRAMFTTVTVGLVGAVLMVMAGLAMIGMGGFGFFIAIIGVFCGLNCYRMRQMLKTEGPWAYQDEDEVDYSASIYDEPSRPKRKWFGGIKARRARRLAREEQAEQAKIDEILAKVSRQGMQSLTWWEKRTLRRATERQRERDLELSRARRSGLL